MLIGMQSDDKSIGSNYNVEYKWGNNKLDTFNGDLENVDKDNFWFRICGQLIKINQDRVIIMIPKPIEKDGK